MQKSLLCILIIALLNPVFANKKSSKLLSKIHEKDKEDKILKASLQNEQKEALLKKIQSAKGGFFIGRIYSRIFEHEQLNEKNWMTPNEAVNLCERTLSCAGFTYKGSKYAKDIPVWIYFVFYFPSINLSQRDLEGNLHWTSYRVNREYVALKGQPLIQRNVVPFKLDSEKLQFVNSVLSNDIEKQQDTKWPFPNHTVAVTFSANADIRSRIQGFSNYMIDEHNDEDKDHLTVFNLHDFIAQEGVISTGLPTICIDCRSPENDLRLEMFYTDEFDNSIRQLKCHEITESFFENDFIRKRLPSKLVDCLNNQQLKKWTAAQLLKRLDEDNAYLSGEYIDKGQYVFSDKTPPSTLMGYLNTANKFDVEVQPSSTLLKELLEISQSPDIKDLREMTGKKVNRWMLKFQSVGTGKVAKIDTKRHEWTKSTLLEGSRWWIIFPRDIQIIQCRGSEAPIWNARTWFSHIFTQVSRLKFYGSLPVQTIQNPGDVIYVPSGTSFAYYNVGGPVVDLVEQITAIDSIEILQEKSIQELLTNPDDIKRVKAMKEQLDESEILGLGAGIRY